MRVVSFVPSLTETLLACGVSVVGRTRFCVHPAEAAGSIPVVGGTKDFCSAELLALRPDLVLVDREENVPAMVEGGWPTHVMHVQSPADMPGELGSLARRLENPALARLAQEWRQELTQPVHRLASLEALPGVLSWIQRPTTEPRRILYLIWRGPWMAVSADTFVGGMLARVGVGERLPAFSEKYPKIDLADFSPAETLLLFASEPYPFGKKAAELRGLGFPAALVDGEAYSWFGIRSLRFLQSIRAGV